MGIFKIAAGVILILTGIFCFATPGATFFSVAFVLGCSMLFSGASGILAYVWIGRRREVSNLLLVEGISGILLGILVLSNQLTADAAIPVFFGLWVMFSGIMRIVEGLPRMKSGIQPWCWPVALGALGTFIGFYSFYNTVLFNFSPVMLVGILFVMQGVNVLMVGVGLSFCPKWMKHTAKG